MEQHRKETEEKIRKSEEKVKATIREHQAKLD